MGEYSSETSRSALLRVMRRCSSANSARRFDVFGRNLWPRVGASLGHLTTTDTRARFLAEVGRAMAGF